MLQELCPRGGAQRRGLSADQPSQQHTQDAAEINDINAAARSRTHPLQGCIHDAGTVLEYHDKLLLYHTRSAAATDVPVPDTT